MLRVYLDTNVLNELRTSKDAAVIRFKDSVLKHKANFLYCYSTPHLIDLLRDTSDNKFDDLAFMEELVNDNYIRLDKDSEHRVTCYRYNPVEAFNEDVNQEYYGNIQDSLKVLNDPELLSQHPHIGDMLNKKMDFGLPDFDKLPEASRKMLEMFFPNSKDGISVNDMLGKFSGFYNNWMSKGSDSYRDMRRSILETLPLAQYDLDITELSFDRDFKETPVGKTFMELVEQTVANQSEEKTFFKKFTTAYLSLNILGLDNEKNKKARFSNTLHDAQHVFFGGHCDILVTQEKGMITKAKALYNLFKSDTQVYSMEEFMDSINIIGDTTEPSSEKFWELFIQQYKNGMVLDRMPDIEAGEKYDILKTQNRFLGYFNRMQKPSDGYNGDIVLTNNPRNFSVFTFFDEIRAVVNKAAKLFGTDYQFKGEFTEAEEDEIRSKTWQGRHWDYGKEMNFSLSFLFDRGRLAFIVRINTNHDNN